MLLLPALLLATFLSANADLPKITEDVARSKRQHPEFGPQLEPVQICSLDHDHDHERCSENEDDLLEMIQTPLDPSECSEDDDEAFRNAEPEERCSEDEEEAFRHVTNPSRINPTLINQKEPIGSEVIRGSSQTETLLDEALAELNSAKNILSNIEEKSQRIQASRQNQDLQDIMKTLRMQIEAAERKRKEDLRAAEAHHHYSYHKIPIQHSVPGLNLNINQGLLHQATLPGLHQSSGLHHSQVVLPGLHQNPGLHQSNLNINQNQAVNLHTNPLINQGTFPGQTIFRTTELETKPGQKFPHQDGRHNNFVNSNVNIVGEAEEENLQEEREASPTKKKKKPKYVPIYVHQYPPQHYGRYREAEEDEIEDDMRVASPTKKKKKKLVPIYIEPYYPPRYYSDYYRGAEESEMRDASPTKKKKQKIVYVPVYTQPPYKGYHRSSLEDENPLTKRSFLFDVPERHGLEFKRSIDDLDQILGQQRKIIDHLAESSKNDDDLKFIADIGNKTLTDLEEKNKNITKRSIPLTRLISDPNVQLDVPKTIENFGTVAKNAFEDHKAPMYHVKHMIGSSRNALLSAMKIPPQKMIIPSDYEIVKTEDTLEDINPDFLQNGGLMNTFRKVGEMVKESIKSGQETAGHIGDVAHNARSAIHTARQSAPKFILPLRQVPALKNTRKSVLITPRIVDLSHKGLEKKPSDSRANFVGLGHLMDAVGLSRPEKQNFDLQKFIFEPKNILLDDSFTRSYKNDVALQALNTLEDVKVSTGAKNLKDLLLKMRSELTGFVPEENVKQNKEMGKFIENLFDGHEKEKREDVVGGPIFMAPELLHPFMGQATQSELKSYHKDNGDEGMDVKDETVSAVNPLMLERIYGESVDVKNEGETGNLPKGENDGDKTVGTFMTMTEPMLKPFMGRPQPEQIESFLDTYNKDPGPDMDMMED